MKRTVVILIMLSLLVSSAALAQTRQKSMYSPKNYAFTQLLNSPEITDHSVIFRVLAPNAKRVAITGSWENFYTEQEMTKGEDGVWTYEMPLLPPDIYQYVFDIDGMVVLDPGNYSQTRDMYNYRSNLIIRGPGTEAYYAQNSVEKGRIEKVWYPSKEYGTNRRVTVYLPYGYDESKGKYPVLYLQHGGGGDEEAWQTLGRLTEIMDYMIEKKLCKPMVVVLPNGNASEIAACETALPDKFLFSFSDPEFRTGAKYLRDLRGDLMPFIASHFKVRDDKAGRAVAGLSMGGGHTCTLMRESPELFDYYGVFSAGGMRRDANAPSPLIPLKKAGYKVSAPTTWLTTAAWTSSRPFRPKRCRSPIMEKTSRAAIFGKPGENVSCNSSPSCSKT